MQDEISEKNKASADKSAHQKPVLLLTGECIIIIQLLKYILRSK
jgi:hypothetical protein